MSPSEPNRDIRGSSCWHGGRRSVNGARVQPAAERLQLVFTLHPPHGGRQSLIEAIELWAPVCGLMTALEGLGHTMPYLISSIKVATAVAVVVVMIELLAIAWVRNRFMDTPWTTAVLQVVGGGLLVFLAGILIGSA